MKILRSPSTQDESQSITAVRAKHPSIIFSRMEIVQTIGLTILNFVSA